MSCEGHDEQFVKNEENKKKGKNGNNACVVCQNTSTKGNGTRKFFFAFLPTFFAEYLTVTFLLCILPGITHKLYMCNCAQIRHHLITSEECRMWNL